MHHLIPQAPCLVTAGGEWAADYVVRTERMEEDRREVGGWVGGWVLTWGTLPPPSCSRGRSSARAGLLLLLLLPLLGATLPLLCDLLHQQPGPLAS